MGGAWCRAPRPDQRCDHYRRCPVVFHLCGHCRRSRRDGVSLRLEGQVGGALCASLGAELADGQRRETKYSLSPTSLVSISRGTRLVLPSPNGATLSFGTGATPTLTGCLRNGRAVAAAAQEYGRRIAVIPAGERWRDGGLRPAFEDWVGAGAILSHLPGVPSPEAQAAVAAYHYARQDLASRLKRCRSGKELIERGFEHDVVLASALDVSVCVPILVRGAYVHKQA